MYVGGMELRTDTSISNPVDEVFLALFKSLYIMGARFTVVYMYKERRVRHTK